MRFIPAPIPGVTLIELEPIADERGFFARAWCAEEFEREGLDPRVAQANLAFSPRQGTLRGLHYQNTPDLEAKVVRCVRGRIWDVIVDLRPGSASFRRWHGVELDASRRQAVYVPPLCAHGYLTLEPDCEVWYQATTPYAPDSALGIRWSDPAIGIEWPAPVTVVGERDRTWPLLEITGTS